MNRLIFHLVSGIVFFGLVACEGKHSSIAPTVSPVPSVVPSEFSTATAIPSAYFTPTIEMRDSYLSGSVILTSYLFNSGYSPDITISAQTPALIGSSDLRVVNFNHEMYALVQQLINEFEVTQKNLPADPTLAKSFLDVRFNLVSTPGTIFSLKFIITTYMKGAAHPYYYTRTLTYDLEKGVDVTLADLFLPGVDFLGPISESCLTQLIAREIGKVLSIEGALPDLENYRNWNITADGLLITFDQYQVAPGAAGLQIVTIPYATLAYIIDPKGPLAGLLP